MRACIRSDRKQAGPSSPADPPSSSCWKVYRRTREWGSSSTFLLSRKCKQTPMSSFSLLKWIMLESVLLLSKSKFAVIRSLPVCLPAHCLSVWIFCNNGWDQWKRRKSSGVVLVWVVLKIFVGFSSSLVFIPFRSLWTFLNRFPCLFWRHPRGSERSGAHDEAQYDCGKSRFHSEAFYR